MPAFRKIDGRALPPPEPFERTLEALEELPQDAHVLLVLDCSPGPLFNYLRRNGYRWTEEVDAEGTNVIRIERRPVP
jgi:uncharacterized protein (DUF2249 family)